MPFATNRDKIHPNFQEILAKASQIDDPFEQAFFVLVHIPYLQPFEDVNKRVSRLGANKRRLPTPASEPQLTGAYVMNKGTSGMLRLVLIAALLCCATAAVANDDRNPGLLRDFHIVQNGQELHPINGVLTLKRDTFYIWYTGKAQWPSVYASSNPKVKEQFQSLHDPLVSWTGTGNAAYPSQLLDSEPLEIFEGWSPAFEKAEGRTVGREGRAAFSTLRKLLPAEPVLLASGRNYANFGHLPDGSRVYKVSQIDDQNFPVVDHMTYYLILFADNHPAGRDFYMYFLDWSPLTIQFAPAP